MKFNRKLTIPNGGVVSEAMVFNELRWATTIVLYPPVALSGVVTVEVTDVKNPAAGDWRTLQSEGVDVTLTVDDATVLTHTGFLGLRLATTIAPGADEVYGVVVNE